MGHCHQDGILLIGHVLQAATPVASCPKERGLDENWKEEFDDSVRANPMRPREI